MIDGTLQGPAALIELVAFHLHRLGAAKAREVVFVADGAPWIWARLDWVVAQVGLNPLRVVEVLDWCHGVHHVSVALEALKFDKATRTSHYNRLRKLLKQGKSQAVIEELEALAEGSPADSPVRIVLRGGEDSVVLEVHNQGPPIPPELLPRLFEAFERGAAGAGLGLGLYIARELADANGAVLELLPKGPGAHFRLTMKRALGPTVAQPEAVMRGDDHDAANA